MLPYWLSKTRMENLLPNEGCAKKSATNMSVFLVLVMLLLSLRLALFLTISANMLLQFCLRLPNNLCFLLVQIHYWAVTSKLFSVNHFPFHLTGENTKKLGKHGGKSYAIEQNPHEIQKIVAGCVFLNGRPFPRKQFSISICWCFPKCKNLCLVFSVSRIFFWQRPDQNDAKRTFLIDQASSLCLWWEPFLTNKQHPQLNNP